MTGRSVGDWTPRCDRVVGLSVAADPGVKLEEPLGDAVGVNETGDGRVARALSPLVTTRCCEYVSRVINELERVMHKRSTFEAAVVAVGHHGAGEI